MSSPDPVLLQIERAIATITLNRPECLNALDLNLVYMLREATQGAHREAKVILLKGAGRAFSAGADLRFVAQATPHRLREFIRELHRLLRSWEEGPTPVVAAVHGYALAGGLELVLASDIAVAAEDAQLGDRHIEHDLIPGGGGSQRLPRAIGWPRARDLLLTGRMISGAEAAEWGLIARSVPSENLKHSASELVQYLASRSSEALRRMKQLVGESRSLHLARGLAAEEKIFGEYALHPDYRAGVETFLKRRTASTGTKNTLGEERA